MIYMADGSKVEVTGFRTRTNSDDDVVCDIQLRHVGDPASAGNRWVPLADVHADGGLTEISWAVRRAMGPLR